MELILVVAWVAAAIGIGWVAQSRGRSAVGWIVVSIVCSPVVAYALLVATPLRGDALMGFDPDLHSVCHACKGPRITGASRCQRCGVEGDR